MFKDGLATKTDYVTVYNYNEHGEFTGGSTILVEEGTGIPAQSTLEKVNREKKGFARVFDGKWTYVEDHRGTEVYDINTKQKEEVKYLGEIKDEHTLLVPPSHNHEFINGEWIITKEKKAELDREEKEREINELESQKQKLIGEMQMHQLLDELGEAKAIALRVKEINAKIAELEK